MLTYELALLLRIMPKEELAGVVKRASTSIFNQGGIIRKIDNLGTRKMPFKTSNHGSVHREAQTQPQTVICLAVWEPALLKPAEYVHCLNLYPVQSFPVQSYFVLSFTAPPAKLTTIEDECRRDVDIVRKMIYKVVEPEPYECNLEEELKPPPYRPEVIKMMEEAKAKSKKSGRSKFKFNTGLDYYPFQR